MAFAQILALQDALKISHRTISVINDPLWWEFALSNNTEDHDSVLNRTPDDGNALLRSLGILHIDGDTYHDEKGEDLGSKLGLIRRLLPDAEEPPKIGITDRWLEKWSLDPEYLGRLKTKYPGMFNVKNDDAWRFIRVNVDVAAFEEIHNQPTNILNLFGQGYLVSRRTYENYRAADILEYSVSNARCELLHLNSNRRGVLVFHANYNNYNLHKFLNLGENRSSIPQPNILIIDEVVAFSVLTKMKVRLVFATFDEIAGTFEEVFRRSDNSTRSNLCSRVYNIVKKNNDIMHGAVDPRSILVTSDGKPLFTNFSNMSRIGGNDKPPKIRMWYADGYVPEWDAVCFASSMLQRFYTDEYVRGKFFRDLQRRAKNSYACIKNVRVDGNSGNFSIDFVLTHGETAIDTYTITISDESRQLTLENPIQRHHFAFRQGAMSFTIDVGELVSLGYTIGDGISSGSYGNVFSIASSSGLTPRIVKLGVIQEAEHIVQMKASELGFAPKIHGFYQLPIVSKRGDASARYTRTMPALIMDAMDMTVETYMGDPSITSAQLIAFMKKLFDVVTLFGMAGFMHHDLKTDNVMILRESNPALTPKIFIIDYGKAWYAGADRSTPYGQYVKPNGDMISYPWNFNNVAWMGHGMARNVSAIYDRMTLFFSITRQLRHIRERMNRRRQDHIILTQEVLQTIHDEILMTDVVGIDETTEVKVRSWNKTTGAVILTYIERPRVTHPEDLIRTWRVERNNIVVKQSREEEPEEEEEPEVVPVQPVARGDALHGFGYGNFDIDFDGVGPFHSATTPHQWKPPVRASEFDPFTQPKEANRQVVIITDNARSQESGAQFGPERSGRNYTASARPAVGLMSAPATASSSTSSSSSSSTPWAGPRFMPASMSSAGPRFAPASAPVSASTSAPTPAPTPAPAPSTGPRFASASNPSSLVRISDYADSYPWDD